MAYSPDGQTLAAGAFSGEIHLYDAKVQTLLHKLHGHADYVSSLPWAPDGKLLASGSTDKTVRVWSGEDLRNTIVLEQHTHAVIGVSFSVNGQILASRSSDGTLSLWRTADWGHIATIGGKETGSVVSFGGLAFHPRLPILAALDNDNLIICTWDIDARLLLADDSLTPDSIRYTAAKVVLVGDPGMGKTGLGWRLAHGEYKEHDSTHGQQFWVIDELGQRRTDGTECEVVLWDLAGQPVYRQVHAIFLENVDASLVLFDSGNRQEPFKGIQFWLEHLKGKDHLPPAVLVGARVDRGAPAVSPDDLAQFCQHYSISGGYISTSAKTGEGLEQLLEILKEQIPWEDMTATVTTVTFKRVKKYVLALKAHPDRRNALVEPDTLYERLQATDHNWEFTADEMLTAVGHLETHGYGTRLRSSAGAEYILLTPELLVNLASSIMLRADRDPHELGTVNETELLQDTYPFDELKDLDLPEREVLLDAAVHRFVEHNVCFREKLYDETLLIFPGLIKQKRPLRDDFHSTDDMSYIVSGQIENLYAMLVVLLGYTPSFTRIHQWQNQAQYEMGKGEICGFRLIEDREGEIELVLYYSEQMPQDKRGEFLELFEWFLYQRERVNVTMRILPVVCPNGHKLERATVVSRIRKGKTFAHCAECGSKVDLPNLESSHIGINASPWLQQEAATARLRSLYEAHLTDVKSYRRNWAAPRCYLSYIPEQRNFAERLIHDLQAAGMYFIEHTADVGPDDDVVVLDTPTYQQAWHQSSESLADDKFLIQSRMDANNHNPIFLVLKGKPQAAVLHELDNCDAGNFCDTSHYPVSLFNLVLELYAIPLDHAAFQPLRQSLHQQWEQTLVGDEDLQRPELGKRFAVALSFPGEHRKLVKTVADALAKQLGRERVFYDTYYSAELARPDMDAYLQNIYHHQAELVVVFLCDEYGQEEWCGLEWRAIRDLLKHKKSAEIMPVRLTDIPRLPSGLFSIDGYLDAKEFTPAEVADLIVQRLRANQQET